MPQSARSRPLARRRLGRRGVAVLDFAIGGSILILVMLTAIEFGRYYFTQQSVRYLVAEAARDALLLASSNPPPTTQSCVTGAAAFFDIYGARAPALTRSAATTAERCLQPPIQGSSDPDASLFVASARLVYRFEFVLKLAGLDTVTITESARLQQR